MRPDVALISAYPPSGQHHGGHSGVAPYSANLARSLVAAGARVVVVAPELDGEPERFEDDGVEVWRAFRSGAWALPSALRAASSVGADITHLQYELFLYGGSRSLVGLFPALARYRGSPPLVTTMHQVVDPSTVDRAFTRLHDVAAPAPLARTGIAAVQSALTRASAATIVHDSPFRRMLPGATVIPHGIEKVEPVDPAEARRALGLGDRLVVLCFGFLAPYKGLELVLEAARHLEGGVDVVVAGGDHPRLLAAGRSFGTELQARYGDVARFTGWVPDRDVGAWFSAADVALFTYPKPFSSSGVLALAMAYGTGVLLSPTLARSAGAPSVLTAAMDPVGLAAQIEALAADPVGLAELRHWTGVLARGRCWPAVAQRHLAVYEEVLDVQRDARRTFRAG